MTDGLDGGSEVQPTGQGQQHEYSQMHTRTDDGQPNSTEHVPTATASSGTEQPPTAGNLNARAQKALEVFSQHAENEARNAAVLLTDYKELIELQKALQDPEQIKDMDQGELDKLRQQIQEKTVQAQEQIIVTIFGRSSRASDTEGGLLAEKIEETPLTELAAELLHVEAVRKLGISPNATYKEIITQVSEHIAKLPEEQRKEVVVQTRHFGQQLKEAAAYLALKPNYVGNEKTRKVLQNLYNVGDTISHLGEDQGRRQAEDIQAFAEKFVNEINTNTAKRGELTVFILTGKDEKTVQTDPLVSYFLKRKTVSDDATGQTRLETDEEYYGRLLKNEDKRLDRLQESLTKSVADGKAARKIRDEITRYAYDALSSDAREKLLHGMTDAEKAQALEQGDAVIEGAFGPDGVRLLRDEVAETVQKLRERIQKESGREPLPQEVIEELTRLVGRYETFKGKSIAGEHILNQLYDEGTKAALICVSSDYVLAPMLAEQFKEFAKNDPQFAGAVFGAETVLEPDGKNGHSYLVVVTKDGKIFKIDPTNEHKFVEEIKDDDEAARLKKKYSADEASVRAFLLDKNEAVVTEKELVDDIDETTGQVKTDEAGNPKKREKVTPKKVKREPTQEEVREEIQRRQQEDNVYKQLEASMLYNLRFGKTDTETNEFAGFTDEQKKQFIDKAYDLDPNNFLVVLEKARLTQEVAEKNRLIDQARSLYKDQFDIEMPEEQIQQLLSQEASIEIKRVPDSGVIPDLVGPENKDVRDLIDHYRGLREPDEAVEALDEILNGPGFAGMPQSTYRPPIAPLPPGVILPREPSVQEFHLQVARLQDQKQKVLDFTLAAQQQWDKDHPGVALNPAQQQAIDEAKARATELTRVINGLQDLITKQEVADLMEQRTNYQAYVARGTNQLGAALTPADITMLNDSITTVINPRLAELAAQGYGPRGNVTDAEVHAVVDPTMLNLLTAWNNGENFGLFLTADQAAEFRQKLQEASLITGRPLVAETEIRRLIDQMAIDIEIASVKDQREGIVDVNALLQQFEYYMSRIEERGVEVTDLVNQQENREPMWRIVGTFENYVRGYVKKHPGTPEAKKLEKQLVDLKAENWGRPWLWEANRIIGTNFTQNSAMVEEYQKRVKNGDLFTLMNIEHVGLALRIRAQVAEKYLTEGKRMTPDVGKQIDDEAKTRLAQEVQFLAANNPHDDISIDPFAIDRASGIAKIIDGNFYLTGKRGARARLPQSYEQYSKQSQSVANQAFDPFGQFQLLEGLPHIGYTLLKKVGLEKMKNLYYMGDWVTYGTNREAAITALNGRSLYDFDLFMRLRHQFESKDAMLGFVHELQHKRDFEVTRVRDSVIAAGYTDRAQIEAQVDYKMEEWDKGWLKIFQGKSRLSNHYYGDEIDPATGKQITATQAIKRLLEDVHHGHDITRNHHGDQQIFFRSDVIRKMATYEPTTFFEANMWGSKDLENILTANGTRAREDGIKIFRELDKELGRLQELDYYNAKKEITNDRRKFVSSWVTPPPGVRADAFVREDPEAWLTHMIATDPRYATYGPVLQMYRQLRAHLRANAGEYATAKMLAGKAVRYNRNVVTETDMFWEIYRYSDEKAVKKDMTEQGFADAYTPEDNAESAIGNNSMANATGRIIQGYNFSQGLSKVFSSPQSYEAVTKLHGAAGWLDRSEEEEFIALVEAGRLKLFRYDPILGSEETIDKMRTQGVFFGIVPGLSGLHGNVAETTLSFGRIPGIGNALSALPGLGVLADTGITFGNILPENDLSRANIPVLSGLARLPLLPTGITVELEKHQRVINFIERVVDVSRLHLVPISESKRLLGRKGMALNPTEMMAEIRDMVAKGLIRPEDAKNLERQLNIIWQLRWIPWAQIIVTALLMTFVGEFRGILEGK